MNAKKAKAIRRNCQERFGSTKAKTYYKQSRKRPVFDKDLNIVGNTEVSRVVADEPRREYQKEKKAYNALPKKARAGRYV